MSVKKRSKKFQKQRKWSEDRVSLFLNLGDRAIKENRRFRRFISDEDIKQEYITRLLEGRHKRATVGQAVIDIYRETVLDPRRKDYNEAVAGLYGSSEIQEWHSTHDPTESLDDRVALLEIIKTLDKNGMDFIKRYLSGMSLVEIAEEMGVSGARSSQIFADIIENLKRAFNRVPLRKTEESSYGVVATAHTEFAPQEFEFRAIKENPNDFRVAIKNRIKDHGGVAWLSSASGIDKSSLYCFLNKTSPIRRPTIEKISRVLNFNIIGIEEKKFLKRKVKIVKKRRLKPTTFRNAA